MDEDDDVMGGGGGVLGGNAQSVLRSFVERVEKLEEEEKAIRAQKKEVYDEAKGNGFDVKTMRKVVQLRKMRPEERSEAEAMLDLYLHALGMVPEGE